MLIRGGGDKVWDIRLHAKALAFNKVSLLFYPFFRAHPKFKFPAEYTEEESSPREKSVGNERTKIRWNQ